MSLLFKEVYESILKVEKSLSERRVELKDVLFDFWAEKLLLLAYKTNDSGLSSEVTNFLRSSNLENFYRVISLLKGRKNKYLKKQIFIVFGRNKQHFQIVRDCIESSGFECDFLDTTNTFVGSPIILPTLIERISSSFKVLVIASADNEGRRIGSDSKLTARPRLNVVLEAGLSYGILDMHNVLLLWDKRVSIARITDLQGIMRIDIEEDENQWKQKLIDKLEKFNEEWEGSVFC
ncbi:TIR domain-containing protein [Candidatus Mycoplasma haematobovis]|uniref:TIR domain-containing protein n=1 Tax=Candidatus Mycoplasma haematobovis TaxID=432608 RepID=UPI000A7276D8|nr:TIR domain-containing protein [Candidatus Mycoplasma haematobovis]